MLVIHGDNSDILSAETVAAMAGPHAGMQVIEVPDQGHGPPLDGDELIGRIARFIETCEPAARAAAAHAKSQDGDEPLLSSSTQR